MIATNNGQNANGKNKRKNIELNMSLISKKCT